MLNSEYESSPGLNTLQFTIIHKEVAQVNAFNICINLTKPIFQTQNHSQMQIQKCATRICICNNSERAFHTPKLDSG